MQCLLQRSRVKGEFYFARPAGQVGACILIRLIVFNYSFIVSFVHSNSRWWTNIAMFFEFDTTCLHQHKTGFRWHSIQHVVHFTVDYTVWQTRLQCCAFLRHFRFISSCVETIAICLRLIIICYPKYLRS